MTIYGGIAVALFLYMNVSFALSCLVRRNDVADIAWGLGFVIMSWLGFAASDHSLRSGIVTVLVTIWGLRLAWHIAERNLKKQEDHRYAVWRQTWNFFMLRSYLQIFMLQGFFLYIILFPVLFIHTSEAIPLYLLDALAIALWLVGFFFESVGDYQLQQFLRDPANKGKIMDRGLWAYSRHPNYFGEVTQWWGIFLCALSLPGGYITIVSPLLITILILFVSGVPMLEEKYAAREDFKAYKKRTSMFVPWPPKKG